VRADYVVSVKQKIRDIEKTYTGRCEAGRAMEYVQAPTGVVGSTQSLLPNFVMRRCDVFKEENAAIQNLRDFFFFSKSVFVLYIAVNRWKALGGPSGPPTVETRKQPQED
jgi:hypothetical protein